MLLYFSFFQKLLPTLISFDLMDHPFLDVSQDSSAGFRAIAKNDSNVQEAAAFVVDQYNLRGDEDELYVFTQVVSAHLQVSSSLYRSEPI